MSALVKMPPKGVCDIWNNLRWETFELKINGAKTTPIKASNVPKGAGVYRVFWDDESSWKDFKKKYTAKASKKIKDATVDISELEFPLCLSIGRTTDVSERIKQHFGTNKNDNRLFSRFRQIAPQKISDEKLRKLIINNVRMECAINNNWIERCLLESYGKALIRPLFDLDAEH